MIKDRERDMLAAGWLRPLAALMTILLLVAVAGCGGSQGEPPSPGPRVGVGESTAASGERAQDYRNLGPDEFRVYREDHPEGFLLDVRDPDEWDGELGHLDGAVQIPADEVAARMDELPADHSTPVMVYCRSGRRSARVAWILFLQGYERILNLDGGMMAYRDEGY